MNHCCFCGAAISDSREVEIPEDDRRKIVTPLKSTPYAHTGCWDKYRSDLGVAQEMQTAFYEAESEALLSPEQQERRTFLDALAARLEMGAQLYGNHSFDEPMATTTEELEAEALDIAGWAYVMWVQIRRRCARLEQAADELLQ